MALAPRAPIRPSLKGTKPLGDAVDEQVDDAVLGEIALAEVLVFGPQPLGDLAHRRPRQKPPACLVGEGVLDVARRQAPRIEARRSSSCVRPESADRTRETNGSGVSRTCGAEYSTAPSAVFTLCGVRKVATPWARAGFGVHVVVRGLRAGAGPRRCRSPMRPIAWASTTRVCGGSSNIRGSSNERLRLIQKRATVREDDAKVSWSLAA